jgi:hypothetical protein
VAGAIADFVHGEKAGLKKSRDWSQGADLGQANLPGGQILEPIHGDGQGVVGQNVGQHLGRGIQVHPERLKAVASEEADKRVGIIQPVLSA